MPFTPSGIYFRREGRGPTKVVFLMGMTARHVDFCPQIRHFGRVRGGDFEACFVDNRGCGFSAEGVRRSGGNGDEAIKPLSIATATVREFAVG